MTSSDAQVNGNGVLAMALVVLFVVGIMGASFIIDRIAWAYGAVLWPR